MSAGTVHSINVSDGGVPKLPRASAQVRAEGVEGDRQRDRHFHGGPQRAVSLYSLERIEALQREGHPVAAGSMGENLTIAGLAWPEVRTGRRLRIGPVELEVTKPAHPCRTIAGSFADGRFDRVSEKVHPGWSRYYARVVREGTIRVGDAVELFEADGPG